MVQEGIGAGGGEGAKCEAGERQSHAHSDVVLQQGQGGDGVGCTREMGPVGQGWEPLDRSGSCGLWLRLVMVPLMRECLEGSYRGKLLALHMTQVC